jgi:hypothetical protein
VKNYCPSHAHIKKQVSMSMCVCIYIYICIYMYINIFLSIYIYIRNLVYNKYTHNLYICIYICMYMYRYVFTYVPKCTYILTYECVCLFTNFGFCIQRMHTNTHINIYNLRIFICANGFIPFYLSIYVLFCIC